MAFKQNTPAAQDTGWGLIYRLNDLLNAIEILAPQGKYDDWNYKLDRIWINLCYREDCEVTKDEDGKIIEIKLKASDTKEKKFLDKKIVEAKREMKDSMRGVHPSDNKPTAYFIGKNKLYEAITLKDIWIRKLMRKNNLYLKEVKHNPAGAMWNQ